MIENNFSKTLYQIRTLLGWSQSELSERSGLTPACISLMERGIREPELKSLIKLCNALQVTPDKLITGFSAYQKRKDSK